MTREEREKAIDLLDNLIGMIEDNQNNDYDFALKKGIEALKQETVSRESYEHEYFLRKELELKVLKLEKQIAEQEPFINKPCVSTGACEHDKNVVLDKVRAEIEQDAFKDVNGSKYIFINQVNQIIDKYKAESEVEE